MVAFALALLTTAARAQPVAEPQSPEAWRTVALTDLAALREELTANSPVGVDTENPALTAWLSAGYEKALPLAQSAADKAGYFYALNVYANGFRDPHINLSPVITLPAARWPGFIAARRGGATAVVHSDGADAPPAGAEIVACDGESIPALLESRVFAIALNPGLALDRRRAPTRLFLDRGVPFAPAPARCTFRIDGAETERTLVWRALPTPEDSFWQRYNAAAAGPGATWGVSEPAPGVHWIGIPTFSSGPETAPKLQTLVADITAKAALMRAGRAIVFDVRGNGGGNTAWSNRVIEALYPADVLRTHRAPERRSAVDWRVSSANIAFWRETRAAYAAEFGPDSDEMGFVGAVIAGLERAQRQGDPLWRQGARKVGKGGGLTGRRPRGESPFPARVFVLSNGTCGSTCLNFLDRVLFVPGAQLIGSDSSGDTANMEVRQAMLPSGLVRLTLPQKVYRGAARGHLEAYAADVAYEGAWDDAAVRSWALEVVQR